MKLPRALAAAALSVGLLPGAVTAPPPAGAAPAGALQPLTGRAGCHASLPGFKEVPRHCTKSPIKYVGPMALSPDGRHLYTANGSFGDPRAGTVAMFARDRRSGALHRLAAGGGCLGNERRFAFARRCGTARVGAVEDVAVSPDGRHVYVAGVGPEVEVAVLARDARSGRLSQDAGSAGCIGAAPACATGYGLEGVNGLELAPDGRHVYALAEASALAVYERDATTGALTALPPGQGCLTPPAREDDARPPLCSAMAAIRNPSGIALDRDGRHLYVTDAEAGHVTVLARDRAGGALSLLGTERPRKRDDLHSITLSPDGTSIYASGLLGVHAFRRDRADGSLTPMRPPSGAGAVEAFSFAVSPDGRTAYSVGGLDGVAIYARGRSGELRRLRGRAGCVSHDGSLYHFDPGGHECLVSRGLINAVHALVSPDGRHVYVSGTYKVNGVQSQISIFRRRR